MAVKFANLASSTLASSLTNSATSISVTDASSFPTLGAGDYFYASIGEGSLSEIVKVTAVSSNTFTAVRGQDGTTARSHDSGTSVALRVVAAALDDISSQAQSAAELAADNESVSKDGDTMTGDLTLGDNNKLILGGSSNNLEIYNDGSNSIIKETAAGSLMLRGSSINLQNTSNANLLSAVSGGAVKLYNNGALRFQTTATGADVPGAITAYSATISNANPSTTMLTLGSSSQTGYTLQDWRTSSHGATEAYIIAYGASHSTEAGNFAIKNLEASSDIFFELASSVVPLRLTSSGATFAGSISASEQSVFTGNAISGTPNSNAQIVAADSGVAGIAIHSNDGGQGYLWFGDNTNNAVGRIYYNHSTDKVHWRVGGTDDAHTLDSSGNATFSGDINLDGKLSIEHDGSATGDLLSLFSNRFNSTTMYGWGVNNGTLYHKAATRHQFYTATNYDNSSYDVQFDGQNFIIRTGDLMMGGNTFVDSSRNITSGTINSGAITSSGDIDAAGDIYTGSANSRFKENQLRFNASGSSYIDQATTGQTLYFRTSNNSSLDTTWLEANSAGQATFGGNVIVEGNLTVSGTTTTIDTANLNVEDNNITLNYSTGDSSATANGAGITIQDAVNSTTDATITWNTSQSRFDYSHPVYVSGQSLFVGTSTANNEYAAQFQNSAGTTILRARNDGRVLIPSGYLYAQSSEGIYSTGSIKARGGITNDGGNNLSISSGGSDITFNSKNFTSVGTISSGKITATISSSHTTGTISHTNAALDLYNSLQANTDEKGSILTFTDNYFDGTNYIKTTRAAIKGGTDTTGNTADGFLAFYTDAGGANSANERMRIDSDGQVSVTSGSVNIGADGTYGSNYGVLGFGGTTNGYNRVFGRNGTGDGLYLAAATGRKVFVRSNGEGSDHLVLGKDDSYSGYGAIGFGNQLQNGYNRIFGGTGQASGLYITSATDRDIYFRTNGGSVNTFRMTAGGNFQLSNVTVIDSSRNLTNILGLYGNSGTLNHYNTNHLFKSTTSNLQAQINDTGLGIGTSPSAALHVRAVTPEVSIQSNDGQSAKLTFGDATDRTRGGIEYLTTDDMKFTTNNQSQAMIIRYTGDIAMGTANPEANLHVFNKYDVTNDTNKAGIMLSRTGNTRKWLWSAGVSGVSNDYFAIRDVTAGAYRMIIDTSGNVSINSTSTNEKLYVNGNIRADGHYYVGGSTVIDSSRKLVNSTGATIAHSEHQGVKITGTDSNADSAFTSMIIDHNASGSTALTADRSHIAFKVDMDSSATGGDTSNEHRLYGIHNSVKATGDSDLIYGIYSTAEAEQTAGQVSSLFGVYGQATTDAVSGTISNSYGVYGYNSLAASSGTTISNGYALYGKALVGAGQDSNVSSVHGLYAEVEIDASGAGTTISNIYGVRSEIDNDAGTADTTITNSFLFYGNYAGDLATSSYGVYIPDNVRNYFGGSITTGDGSTSTAAYGFNGDLNTGMYSPANHELGFLANGTQRLKVNADGITVTGGVRVNSNSNDTSNSMAGQSPKLYVSGYTSLGGLRIQGIDSSNTIYKQDGDISIKIGTAHSINLGVSGGVHLSITSSGHTNIADGKVLQMNGTTVIDSNSFRGREYIRHQNSNNIVMDMDHDTYTMFKNPLGETRVWLGSTGYNGASSDNGNYYNAANHYFRDASSNQVLTVNSTATDVKANLRVNGTTVITSARVLQSVTANANIITSGTLASARLPSTAVQFGSYSELHSSGDLDDLVGFRLYRVTGGTNRATTSHHNVLQISNSDANKYNVQLAFTTASTNNEFYFRAAANGTYSSWERMFADNYHPNADKWTTARTISLTGDVTGSASVDGSANASISATLATPTDAPTSWQDVVAWNGGLIKDGAVEIHGSGYLRASFLNMTHSVATRNSDTTFYSSTDDYLRKNNATGMRSSLDVPTRTGGDASGTWGISITGDADTVDSLHASSFIRSDADDNVSGHTEWQDNKQVRLGNGADFRMYFDAADTIFRNYAHTNGDILFQGEDSNGTNRALVYMRTDSSAAYVQLFCVGNEKLRTVSTGVNIYGDLTATGNVTAYSDIRKKTNIQPLEGGLDIVKALEPKRFDWIESGKGSLGFIAQEVEEYLPELVDTEVNEIVELDDNHKPVTTGEEEVKSLDYGKMVSVLWAAVKEQSAQIETLNKRIEELENGNH